MKLDHVGLSVANLEASRRFYGDVLGFTLQEDTFELTAVDIRGVVLVNSEGARVELFERRGSQRGLPGHPTDSALRQGLFQFALSTADLSATYRRVISAGAKSMMEPRIAPDGRTLIAFITDIDGNLIELLQRASCG